MRNKNMWFMALLLVVVFMSGCGRGGGGSDSGSSDTTAPTVSSTIPAGSATNVAINRNLSTTFSEAMDASTINTTTFTLTQGGTPVPGAVTYVSNVATFNPASDLAASTLYTATITTGVKDSAGNAFAADNTWNFTTGAGTDTTAPIVSSTIPIDAGTDAAVNANISATFNEGMDPETITTTTFTLIQGGVPVSGAVTYVGFVATFNPASDLAASTLYTATITTGAEDLASNPMATSETWSFTTGSDSDTTAPIASSTNPIDAGIDAAVNTNISATFNEGMDPETITTTTFTLAQGGTPIPGAVTYLGTVATFDPASDLTASTVYTVTITTGVKDLAGNAMASNKTWSFTTGSNTALGPAIVELGTAGNYVILTKTGVTTTGVTAITGDIGASPIAAGAITGFGLILDASGTFSTSALVTGRIYAADYTSPTPSNLGTAISNMLTAYNDAAGRPTPDFTNLGAGDISGLTLVPGLYKWTTGVSIDGTGVTLSGDSNDVWIFQISQDLTLADNATVTLDGTALPKNIFWQVGGGTGVTLNSGSTVKGIILAIKAITMKSGAVVNGRALSGTAVTLIGNTVTQPAD